MSVDTLKSEFAHVSAETPNEENNPLLNEKENDVMNKGLGPQNPVEFGTDVTDNPTKEVNTVTEADFRKDAVDEWPAPKETHYFYIMKFRKLDDQNLKVKLDQADKEFWALKQSRFQLTEKLRAKRDDRSQVIGQFRSLIAETKQFRMIMDEKRKEMEPLQQALGKLRNTNNMGRERGYGICSSEKELNDLIKSLQYRIQHESIPLTEEKQILREIKQLEGTRGKVIANAAMRATIQDSMGEKEVIQDQVKLIGGDLDGVRKDQQAVKAKLKQLDDEKEAIEKQINLLQEELTIVTQKKDNASEKIQELRKQEEEANTCFYQNRMLLSKASDLASKQDVAALKELSDAEVDKFVSLWSSSKAFRDDYERRILSSLDGRQLSRDGRLRNPDEKPLVLPQPPTPTETQIVSKPLVKQPKEDSASSIKNLEKENSINPKAANNKATVTESTLKQSESDEKEVLSEFENVQKVPPPKRNEAEEAKLKEMKREEEMAKAKQALERKKKLAEKAAAKAAIKAQKEAEKKLRDREKRAKKKAVTSVSVPDEEPAAEAGAEVAEVEKAEENAEAPVLAKSKKQKENTLRNRPRPRGSESLSKVILKRKKSTNYWLWAAPAASVLLLLLVAGYYYLL